MGAAGENQGFPSAPLHYSDSCVMINTCPRFFPDFTPNLNNKQLYNSGAATWGLELLHEQTVSSTQEKQFLKYVDLNCIFNIYILTVNGFPKPPTLNG